VIALRQAAAQCQRTIDAFWKKVQKYQPHLSYDSGGGEQSQVSVLKGGMMKIRWLFVRRAMLKPSERT
jgi:hypothetical protein